MLLRGRVSKILEPEKFDPKELNIHTRFKFILDNDDYEINGDFKNEYNASGFSFPLQEGDYLELDGAIDGEDIHFSQCRFADDDEEGAHALLKFLFGIKKSILIEQSFNNSAVTAASIMKSDEQRFRNVVTEIKGISEKTVSKAYDKYSKNAMCDILYGKLHQYGIEMEDCIRIHKVLGDKCLDKIYEYPYDLFFNNELNIPFSTADEIALMYSRISYQSEKRILAGVLACLYEEQEKGNSFCYLEKHGNASGLCSKVAKRLNIVNTIAVETLLRLGKTNKVVFKKIGGEYVVFTPNSYLFEHNISRRLSDICYLHNFDDDDIDSQILEFEKDNSVSLAEGQKKAIYTAVKNNLSIITGAPGTGKTTIISAIIKLYRFFKKDIKVLLAAPTGKAADRMTKGINMEAYTIHRLLSYTPVTGEFIHNKTFPLEAGLIIIDESSMIGEEIMSKFLDAVPAECAVVFIGDSNQLPSVAYGNVLSDMIESGKIPYAELKEVFRQKKGSTLAQKIIDVSNGKMFSTEPAKDFEFISQTNPAACINAILARYEESMLRNRNDYTKVSVLTPTNKGELGTENLNSIIQEIANPGYTGKNEVKFRNTTFRNGDLVIQCNNEVSYGVFNGMVGQITRVNIATTKDEVESIEVTFPEGKCEYTRDRYNKLKLAYALTIHKSQGSEYDDVILVLPEYCAQFSEKKLLYTGMSRAKKKLTIIGSEETVETIINKKTRNRRNTNLTWNIRTDFV